MNKILVLVDKNSLVFSKYNRNINEENLNNTNVINIKNLKFTEDYINQNIELISTFFNLVVLKYNITAAIIKNIEISETVLKVIKFMKSINKISFTEDKELSYVASTLLYENDNIKSIDCYNLPELMFYRFEKDIVKTRCAVLQESQFFKYNNINTYSDIYNKDKIIIEEYLKKDDLDDIFYFFSVNKNLKKIYLKRYSRMNLEVFLNIIKDRSLRNVTIIIYENERTTNDILSDIKLFDKFQKIYNVTIRVKYSKEYKQKNKIKEANIKILKLIIIALFIILLSFIIINKIKMYKDTKNIDKNMEEINKIIEESNESENSSIIEVKEEYASSYYTNYSKVYDELLKINSDTVGWLTLNNTKINYPVVQSTDNDYYLQHAFDKSSNIAGWIYVDYRNNLDNLSKNIIIYGHSMVEGNLMFTSLTNVLKEDWYTDENNLIINFSIKGIDYKWKIFSIYTIEDTNDYLYVRFNTDDKFLSFANKIKSRSIINFNENITKDDHLLTLSTCYKDNNHRIVVHAKKIN